MTDRNAFLLPPEIAQRRPTATVAIAAVIGIVFLLQLLFRATEQTHLLVKMGALVASRVQAGEIWRLASCTFLHAGVMHFALNVVVLIAIGFQLERAIRTTRFLLIYAASAFGGSLASMTFMNSVSVGASGAVWGLMAAQFILARFSKDLLPAAVQAAMLRSAGMNLMLNMLNSFRPGVDWAAHLGGGVVGAAVMAATLASLPRLAIPTPSTAPSLPSRQSDPDWLRPLAAAGAIALLVGLGFGLLRGQVWQASAPPRYQRVVLAGTGVTAEIPSGLILNRSTNPGPNLHQFSYGTIMNDPVVVAIQLPAQSAIVADLDGAYTVNRKVLDKEQPGGKSLGPVSERQIRGRRILEKLHDYGNGLRLQSLVEVTPRGFRRVDLLRRPGLSAEWNGVAEHTLLSMDPGKALITPVTKADLAFPASTTGPTNEVSSRMQRAKALRAKGDHAGAIAEYNRIIQLQPTLGEAFSFRGLARSANRDPSGALADYDQVLEHPLAGLDYTPLHRYLMLRRLAQPDPTGWLAQRIAQWPKQWTTTLGRFLVGAITEQELFAAVTGAPRQAVPGYECEACYFAGMIRLLAGDPTRARDFFQRSLATQLTNYPAHTLARAELARLAPSPR